MTTTFLYSATMITDPAAIAPRRTAPANWWSCTAGRARGLLSLTPGDLDRGGLSASSLVLQCLVKINTKTEEGASDLLPRLCGAKRARTTDPLLANIVDGAS